MLKAKLHVLVTCVCTDHIKTIFRANNTVKINKLQKIEIPTIINNIVNWPLLLEAALPTMFLEGGGLVVGFSRSVWGGDRPVGIGKRRGRMVGLQLNLPLASSSNLAARSAGKLIVSERHAFLSVPVYSSPPFKLNGCRKSFITFCCSRVWIDGVRWRDGGGGVSLRRGKSLRANLTAVVVTVDGRRKGCI